MVTSFWLALMFLTRLPVPVLRAVTAAHQQWVMYFFPLVGVLIGALLWAVVWFLPKEPVLLTSALLLTLWVFITGGLHLDGLADAADAWLGGLGDKNRSLDIMKDPRAGTAAVMTVCCLLIVKFAALVHILSQAAPEMLLWSLLAVPMIGRCVPALLFFTTPYARVDGLASPMLAGAHVHRQLGWVILCLLAAALPLLQLIGLVSIGLWLLLGLQLLLLRGLMLQRLSGVTGDTVGAAVEITEMWALVALAYLVAAPGL